MKRFVPILALLAVWISAGSARATSGVVLSSEALPVIVKARLESDVRRARAERPQAFLELRELYKRLPELDRRKRGRLAPVAQLLAGLGHGALLPMLEMLALDAPARADLTDSAWRALRVGLIDATGRLRDARARPIFEAILDGSESDELVVSTAAEALGRLGDDAAAKKLVLLAGTPGPKQKAVLGGMGDCRRLSIASALADELARTKSAETAEIVVRSLGRVGNAWAWRTPAVLKYSSEESEIRATAARALLAAFVRYEGRVRQAASNALLVVDDPKTLERIAAARRQVPQVAPALDALARRVARNPLR
jgi:hypothetical protein